MGERNSESVTDTKSAETHEIGSDSEYSISKKAKDLKNGNGNCDRSSIADVSEGNHIDSGSSTRSTNNNNNNSTDKITENGIKPENENQSNSNGGEGREYRVAPTKSEFRLRIVPLERLLETPLREQNIKNVEPTQQKKSEESVRLKKLPERKSRQNISVIELSDSETSESEKPEAFPGTKKKEVTKRQQSSIVELSSDSEENNGEESIFKRQPAKRQVTKRQQRNIVELSDSEESDKGEQSIAKRHNRVKSQGAVATALALEAIKAKREKLKAATAQHNTKDLSKFVKRCVVRIKRIALPSNSEASTEENKRLRPPTVPAMSSSKDKPAVQKATTSAAKQILSDSDDSDSDINEVAATAIVAAEDENSNAERDSNSDSKDKSSSESEIIPVRKKRVFSKRKKNSSESGEDWEEVTPKKRSRLVKKNSSDDSDDSGDEDDENKKKHKRKHIRKIIKTKDLDISTKNAAKEEEERRKRIEERQKIYNQIYEKPDSVEVTELVLDFDEETKKPLLEVDKGLLKKLKPHQVAGVKFMWDACFETLKDTDEKPGSGCILAHCMGLGKTLQVVALTHTLLINSRKTKVERVLIISPLSTLNNWAREFKQWISFARRKDIEVYDMSKYKDKPTRIFKLNEWFEEGGVCVLGYDMYRILANEKAKGLRKKQRETLQQALVEPGPDLVVCDEGHLLKNEKTSISKAVTKMRTMRRIVLTGTPLQNNLKEYYCMIQFVKPNLLGTYKEYLNRFVNPITNGQYTDSTERDIRLMKHRSHILHKMLEGCIQRRDYSVLAPYLPLKHEYVVYTTLSELQQQLYEFYMTTQRDVSSSDISGKGARLFQDFQELRRIWTHPMNLRVNSDGVIRRRLLANDSDSMEDFICDDEDEAESNGSSSDSSDNSSKSFASGGGDGSNNNKEAGPKRKTRNNKDANFTASDDEVVQPVQQNDHDPSEWWKRFVEDKELNNINHSPKLVILMRLLQECEVIGDKLLVFSQSLQSIDVIERFLALIDSKTKRNEYEGDVGDFRGLWTPGIDYFRLDGSCSVESREVMCRKFNDTDNLRGRLFLISTRAGGLGINLVAANRVVIFDVSWNPSHDTQSIFRVYRFGQDKPCYIYRLIAMGTMEQKVYERQVAKQATAKRVIDEQQISRHYNQSDLQELYTYELKPNTDREIPILPKDRLFAELLTEQEKLIFKYHEHDSLLENEENENLSEAERKAAWSEYEAEKTRSVQTAQYMSYDRSAYGNLYGNASGSVTSNKIFGFRSDVLLQLLNMKVAQDMPELTPIQIPQFVPTYLQRLYNEMNNGDPTMYKDLLTLHASLAHPSGMYMSPLLFANQVTSAAGYYQAPAAQQQMVPNAAAMPIMAGSNPTPGFDPNHVYEIE